ncbi:MAG: CBS domain-containing protein [Candidatus Coatesbacteria bacterium]|jgi:CBS domain-containing protein|nr:CBS domain-containing protein [Candidatus Coatesbacteria bacterium]
MPARPVSEFMTTEVITCYRSDKLRQVAAIFALRPVSGIPVVNAKGLLRGIITKMELLGYFLPEYLDLFRDIDFIQDFSTLQSCNLDVLESNLLLVEDVMDYEPVTIPPDTSVIKAAALMHKKQLEPLCVVDEEGKLLGVISTTDVCRAFFGQFSSEAKL